MLGGIKIIKTAGTHKEKSAGCNLQRLNLYKMLQSKLIFGNRSNLKLYRETGKYEK